MTDTAATVDTIYQCTPRQVREYVLDCLYADLVPFVKSSPGMGKSSIMRSIAKELGLILIDHRAAGSDPTDFNGLPGLRDGMASFHPFEDLFPLEGTPIPEGYNGWLIFLDEFNSAPKSVQAACYKLILDRQVGQHKLHQNTLIALAGNLETDRAITVQLSTALKSRVSHLIMRTDFTEWLEDVALPQGYDHRIIAYLNWRKDALNNFKPDHSGETFNCQRTWEFMNRLVKDKPILDSKIPLYAGTISSGTAVDFVQFTKVYDDLPKIEDIVADPDSVKIPNDTATRWAVACKLADEVTDGNLGPLCAYINRFGIEFRILFFRTVGKKPELIGHPELISSRVKLSRYLHGGPERTAA